MIEFEMHENLPIGVSPMSLQTSSGSMEMMFLACMKLKEGDTMLNMPWNA